MKLYFIILWFYFIASAGCFGQSVSEIVELIQQGRIPEAQQALNQLENTSKQNDSILFLKGLIACDADEAVNHYQTLIKTYPKSIYAQKAIFRLAQLKYAQGLYRTSLLLFLNIKDDDPKSALLQESRYWAALCYLSMNQKDSAIVQLGRAIAEFPVREISKLASQEMRALQAPVPVIPELDSKNVDEPIISTEPVKTGSSGIDTPPRPTSGPAVKSFKYTIQVGAFSQQDNAQVEKDFFESHGYLVNVRTKMVNGRPLYLVWVGAFQEESEARAFGDMIQSKFGKNTTLISDVQ